MVGVCIFLLISAERGCHPDCFVFCRISENVREIKLTGDEDSMTSFHSVERWSLLMKRENVK